MGRPLVQITAEVRQQVIDLAAQDLGRNEIAKKVGVSPASVTNIMKAAGGHDFGKPHVEVATKARQRVLAAKRTKLEDQLLNETRRLLGEIRRPVVYRELGQFSSEGNRFSEFVTYRQDEPIIADKLKLAQAAGATLDRALKLAVVNGEQNVENGKSMIADLFAGLQQEHQRAVLEEATRPAGEPE